MLLQIIATNHYFRLLKVFTDSKSKHILVNLPLIVELLNKERGTFAARNRSQSHNSIWGHPWETLLARCSNEGHLINALGVLGSKTYGVCGTVAPDVTRAVTYLSYVVYVQELERLRVAVVEIVCCRAGLALRGLYPEPRASCVKYELVGLLSTSKVDRWEDLDVKEVAQVFLEEARAFPAVIFASFKIGLSTIVLVKRHKVPFGSVKRLHG